MHVTIPEPIDLALVLSGEGVRLLLGDDAIANWAWDAAQRFGVSPHDAVRLLASAIASTVQAVVCPGGPVVGVES
jgi:hypothetical protein